jgi:hypothetical protein
MDTSHYTPSIQNDESVTTKRYDAFISYSRKNEDFAARLEQALENYRPPKGLDAPQRRLNIFRDKQDFKVGDYHQNLDSSLMASERLIVICSPEARKSQFVNEEIRRFAKLRGTKNVIPVLHSGIPNNEARPDQAESMAFPAALCELMEMPLAANFLRFDSQKNKVNREPYLDPWYTILAHIYDVNRDEIEQRDRKRRNRTLRMILIGLTGIIGMLSLLLAFALNARQQTAIALKKTEENVMFQERILNVASQKSVPKRPYDIDTLAKRYEGNQEWSRSTDFSGATYYGLYSIKAGGSMNDYIGFLERWFPDLYAALPHEGKDPTKTGQTPAFEAAWSKLARDLRTSERFVNSQRDYIEQKDYKQLLVKVNGTDLATPSGVPYHLNVKARSLALQAVMFSIAVQYGPETSLVRDAMSALPDPSRASDEDIIRVLYKQRDKVNRYFPDLKRNSMNYAKFIPLRNELELRDALYILHHP